MRFAFLVTGTRGDTQPYMALASELVQRGHQAVISANEDFAGFVSKAGLEVVPYAGLRVKDLFDSPRGKEALARGQFTKFLSWMQADLQRHERGIADALAKTTEGADIIVPHVLMEGAACALAEWKKLPIIRTHLAPITPTRAFASPMLNLGWLKCPSLRHLTHRLVQTMTWKSSRSWLPAVCRLLGITPSSSNAFALLEKQRVACAHLVSPTLLPTPEDWGPHHMVTGHCNLPEQVRGRLEEGAVDESLERWLSSGPPPVYFGFGSIPILAPAEFLRDVRQVLEKLGLRGLVISGGSNLGNVSSDERLFFTPAVNHDTVLPRCQAAVHHGGLGTTTATLEAGLPTLICSVFLDQPFWGARVQELGAGTWMPFQRFTPERLSKGLELLLSDPVKARAAQLGTRMRQERGLQNTVDFLEQTATRLRAA